MAGWTTFHPNCDNMNLPPTKAVISTVASLTATVLVVRSLSNDLIPNEVSEYFSSQIRSLSKKISSKFTVVVEEFNGIAPNQMFEAATVYLGSQIPPSVSRIKAEKSDQNRDLTFTIDENEEFVDRFRGAKLEWTLLSSPINNNNNNNNLSSKRDSSSRGRRRNTLSRSEVKYFELSFNRKHRDLVTKDYLPYIIRESESIKREKKEIKLHTVDYTGTDYWSCVNLDHPARFDKMAMDPGQKQELIDDLDRFCGRKEYYKRVGKAWKRGYLLYGPPGTGKSSLVAAMANYLKFDLYDLCLGEVMCNSDLRRLLIGTSSKSILVIEDIDCSAELRNREEEQVEGRSSSSSADNDEKVTLSGLLNFIDGLWSSCGEERLIVLTTNHKDRLDPALLRPGRMDVHIHMSYCGFSGFKTLAKNYLGIDQHDLYDQVEDLLAWVHATPAQVAEQLLKHDDPDVALEDLVKFLQRKGEGTTNPRVEKSN